MKNGVLVSVAKLLDKNGYHLTEDDHRVRLFYKNSKYSAYMVHLLAVVALCIAIYSPQPASICISGIFIVWSGLAVLERNAGKLVMVWNKRTAQLILPAGNSYERQTVILSDDISTFFFERAGDKLYNNLIYYLFITYSQDNHQLLLVLKNIEDDQELYDLIDFLKILIGVKA